MRNSLRKAAAFAVLAAAAVPLPSAAGWRQADAPRSWSFPADHGAHPEYRTEWWYFTGLVSDEAGRRYGYQLTFFRTGLASRAAFPDNPWSVRDVYLAHAALTDASGDTFRYAERASRAGPGLAGATSGALDVRLWDWSARMEGEVIRLRAASPELSLDLAVTPARPPVLHGESGLSRKGDAAGQASHYASITRLATTGTVRPATGAPTVSVTGWSWFDQEFGSNQLAAVQQGWDWFSLRLADGRDLMLYLLRRTDGTVEPASSGTLVEADGKTRHLRLREFSVEVLERWASPTTGGRYPARWRIRVPSAGIDLTVSPLVADQELSTAESTGVTYWEGAVTGPGAEGYVELTGYAE